MLSYASDAYGRHFDWFQRHRDTALKQLGAVLASEILVIRFISEIEVHSYLDNIVLILFAFLSIVFAKSGSFSCERSFRAGLEHAILISKISWVIFPQSKVNVSQSIEEIKFAPVFDDHTLMFPRYITDSQAFKTTKEFTTFHSGSGLRFGRKMCDWNTLHWAKTVIRFLGFSCFTIGVVSGVSLSW